MSVYLDHNATTPVDPQVASALAQAMIERFGNPSSLHGEGQQARRALERAREQIAALLGARPDEVVLTGSGSEADNLAIIGAWLASRGRLRRIVTTAIEHPAVLATCDHLAADGVEVVRVRPAANGVVDLLAVAEALGGEPALLSIMLANNDTGAIQPVAQVAQMAHAHGAIVHCDAVQAAGKMEVDVERLGVDLLSISAHKFYGPKGIGALYIRPGTRLSPLLYGGGQERGLRPGTEAVPLAVGFGVACELAAARLEDDARRMRELRDDFERRLAVSVPEMQIHSQGAPRLPNTSSLSLRGIEGDSLVMALDLQDIAVSTGSACHSSNGAPSHVLEAMGVSPEWSRGTVRFSLGRTTVNEDIDRVLEALSGAVQRRRTAARTAAP